MSVNHVNAASAEAHGANIAAPVSSRRALLQRAGELGLALAMGGGAIGPQTLRGDAAATLPSQTSRPNTAPIAEAAKSPVVHIRAEQVLSGLKVHPSLAGEMVEEALLALTGKRTPADAWHSVLRSDDVVAIKFNHIGAGMLGTSAAFATQLLASLQRAGFAPERIMLVEAPAGLPRELKTRPQVHGWSGQEVSFGSGAERLAALLQEVTAIINVPFLKTHNLAGMTGCLKNLSHALVRRPARYHDGGCAPYVGDILAIPEIRSKLRLHVVNALRAVFDGGPEPRIGGTWPHCGVIVSRDPVAADTVGLDILNERRAKAKLPPIGDALGRVPHVHSAAARGLGTDDPDYINLIEPRPF